MSARRRFLRRERLRRIHDTLALAAEACGRVGVEYQDLARLQRGPQAWWWVRCEFRPLSDDQAAAFLEHLRKSQPQVKVERIPNNTERWTYVRAAVKAPDAAAAFGIVTKVVRSILHDLDLRVQEFDVETAPSEGTPE